MPCKRSRRAGCHARLSLSLFPWPLGGGMINMLQCQRRLHINLAGWPGLKCCAVNKQWISVRSTGPAENIFDKCSGKLSCWRCSIICVYIAQSIGSLRALQIFQTTKKIPRLIVQILTTLIRFYVTDPASVQACIVCVCKHKNHTLYTQVNCTVRCAILTIELV